MTTFVQYVPYKLKRGTWDENRELLGDRVVRKIGEYAPNFAKSILARQVLTLIRSEHYGTYHASDHGDYSWFEFAKKIFEYSAMEVEVTPVSWRDMPFVAPRPRYSVLENCRLQALGIDQMQPIDVALKAYLKLKGVVPALEERVN